MTEQACMASHNLEEKEATHFIAPRFYLGRVDFSLAAIRAVLQSNPPHDETLVVPRFHTRSGVTSGQNCTHWRKLTSGQRSTVAASRELGSVGLLHGLRTLWVLAPGVLSHGASIRLHLCSTNCLRRLSCASDVLFRDSSGTLKVRSQFVQTPTAGTVPSHFVTLRFALPRSPVSHSG